MIQSTGLWYLIEPIKSNEKVGDLDIPQVEGERVESFTRKGKVVELPNSESVNLNTSGMANEHDWVLIQSLGIEVGDIIYYSKWDLHIVMHLGKEYHAIKAGFIIAKHIEDE